MNRKQDEEKNESEEDKPNSEEEFEAEEDGPDDRLDDKNEATQLFDSEVSLVCLKTTYYYLQMAAANCDGLTKVVGVVQYDCRW